MPEGTEEKQVRIAGLWQEAGNANHSTATSDTRENISV
jgi:hypothetical protein